MMVSVPDHGLSFYFIFKIRNVTDCKGLYCGYEEGN